MVVVFPRGPQGAGGGDRVRASVHFQKGHGAVS
jgi:hypothetical protein